MHASSYQSLIFPWGTDEYFDTLIHRLSPVTITGEIEDVVVASRVLVLLS